MPLGNTASDKQAIRETIEDYLNFVDAKKLGSRRRVLHARCAVALQLRA